MAAILLLAILIGLTLGAVGGGGSILAVPVLVGVAGLAVTEATTASLIVVGTSAAIGLLAGLRSGAVRLKTGVAFGLAGIGGAALGTQLNQGLDEGVLLLAFAGLMTVVAAKMSHGLLSKAPTGHTGSTGPSVRTTSALDERGAVSLSGTGSMSQRGTASTSMSQRGTASTNQRETASTSQRVARTDTTIRGGTGVDGPTRATTVVRVLLAGTVVGFLTGLFGVGGGFVIVPALMFLLAFDIREATATSLLVIAINSAVALVMRADPGSVDWSVVAPFTALATVGVLLGRGVADRVPSRMLSASLTVLIIAMAIWTAIQGMGQLV